MKFPFRLPTILHYPKSLQHNCCLSPPSRPGITGWKMEQVCNTRSFSDVPHPPLWLQIQHNLYHLPFFHSAPQSSWKPWNSPENQLDSSLHNISVQDCFQTGMISSLTWNMVKHISSFIADEGGSLCMSPQCPAHQGPSLIPWWFCFLWQKTLALTHLFICCRQLVGRQSRLMRLKPGEERTIPFP